MSAIASSLAAFSTQLNELERLAAPIPHLDVVQIRKCNVTYVLAFALFILLAVSKFVDPFKITTQAGSTGAARTHAHRLI